MKIIFSGVFFKLLLFLALSVLAYGFFIYVVSERWSSFDGEKVVVERGSVVQAISASGKVEAKEITRLGFPVTRVIQNVLKEEGELAEEGEIIASLTNNVLIAEYNSALEQVRYFQQLKKELLRGPIAEERRIASSNVQLAEIELHNVIVEYEQAINNANRSLLSDSLEAYPLNESNDDSPPIISGNYNCEEGGEVYLDIYSSAARSGYSYILSGMETGTFSANSKIPAPLGSCGLYIEFDESENYRNASWVISVPNERGVNYTTLKNAYDLLVAEYQTAKSSAEEAVQLAKYEEALVNAPEPKESLAKADANLNEAIARLTLQEAKIADFTIRAPFSGIVSSVDMKIGESASPNHTVTLIKEGEYDLVAQVPEVDITKILVDQDVNLKFDAESDNELKGKVSFISPVSVGIGGVSYYEVYIQLDEEPSWIREGLNFDLNIMVDEKKNTLKIPERAVITKDGEHYVSVGENKEESLKPVDLGLSGGGMVEVFNLPIGTPINLP